MTNTTLTNALTLDYLCGLIRRAIEIQDGLTPAEQTALQETVRDFLVRNASPFTALMQHGGFTRRHPELTRELLRRAYEVAASPEARALVRTHAVRLHEKDLFGPPEERQSDYLTASQARVLDELRAMAVLYFRGGGNGPLRYRLTPIVMGPTGIGKSHLVRQLGRTLGLSVERFTVADWIPTGARVEPHSLKNILTKVRLGKPWILQMDEADKLVARTDGWSQIQIVEIQNVLDRTINSPQWTDDDRARFRTSCFIVACGTWQEIWQDRGRSAVGFGGRAGGGSDVVQQVRRAEKIPPEVLNRFSHVLVLEPLGAEDFARIAGELGLGWNSSDGAAAVSSGANMRYLETRQAEGELRQIREELRAQKCDQPTLHPSPDESQ